MREVAIYRGGKGFDAGVGRSVTIETDSSSRAKDIVEVKPWKSREVALTERKPKSPTRSSTSEASLRFARVLDTELCDADWSVDIVGRVVEMPAWEAGVKSVADFNWAIRFCRRSAAP